MEIDKLLVIFRKYGKREGISTKDMIRYYCFEFEKVDYRQVFRCLSKLRRQGLVERCGERYLETEFRTNPLLVKKEVRMVMLQHKLYRLTKFGSSVNLKHIWRRDYAL